MDLSTELSSHISTLIWSIFILIIGIALALDFGALEKVKEFLKQNGTKNSNANRKLLNQKEKKRNLIRTDTNDIINPVQTQEEQKSETFTRALHYTILWISIAGLFAVIVYLILGQEVALLFTTGYVLEKSLSVDNMFVFLLIFSSLSIPYIYQHKVLMAGILSAIVMRIGLIIAGVSLLETFHWMIYLFGSLLLFTGIRMLMQKKEKKIDIEKNIAIRILRKFIPVSSDLNGDKFFITRNGVLLASPMLVALIIVEMTDLIFALDSIPAILAITTDPFIVITSNVFAILGLRSLYFLLAGMMEKFYYLKSGLAAILLFIGIKMIISEYYEIPITISLAVIFGTLGIAITLSLLRTSSVIADKDAQK
ncbi:MAG TPA: TerC/Alx family metal homeostasis membrane protein [Nitrososphaeraceae archaeon]|nr:TerC/Alx family metal homeostasis membrane protein [Nitrososphaeraceae archaeon]